jgi:hypothetical protein
MLCKECKTEMEVNNKFDNTEKHLLGPGWTHYICNNKKCKEEGNGIHAREDMKQDTKTKPIKIPGAKALPGKKLTTEQETKLLEIKTKEDEIQNLIEFTEGLYDDKPLTKLMAGNEKIEKKINAKREELGINARELEIQELITQRNTMISEFGPSLPMDQWGPDSFTKGKKDAVTSKDGIIWLLRSKRTTRKIIPSKFIELHPVLVNEMVEKEEITITLKDAGLHLGKEDIDTVCSKETTYAYEIVIKDGRNLPSSG